jgi:hypothetical protein
VMLTHTLRRATLRPAALAPVRLGGVPALKTFCKFGT